MEFELLIVKIMYLVLVGILLILLLGVFVGFGVFNIVVVWCILLCSDEVLFFSWLMVCCVCGIDEFKLFFCFVMEVVLFCVVFSFCSLFDSVFLSVFILIWVCNIWLIRIFMLLGLCLVFLVLFLVRSISMIMVLKV